MPEILNLVAPLLLGSINRENLPKSAKRKGATLTVAGKTKTKAKLFQKVGAVSLVCY
jgi:hypothetical protein